MNVRESAIEKQCRLRVERTVIGKSRGEFHKLTSKRGVLDRLIILPIREGESVIFFCEFKRPGKKPTALQLERIRRLELNGVTAGWADSVESFEALVDRALERHTTSH